MLAFSRYLTRGVADRMFRSILAVMATALVLGAAGGIRASALGEAETVGLDGACEYYKRRAGPLAEREPVSFVVFLSQTCVAARQSLDRPSPEEREAAELLLSRIAQLHRTVSEMNAERDLAVSGLTGVDRMRALSRVTPTGEFLIAHRMGLMRAFDAWLDTGAEFSLASFR